MSFAVDFAFPVGSKPTSATILLGYRSDLVSVPGTGIVSTVRQRVVAPSPPPFLFTPNDRDYALRVVISRTGGLDSALLFTVRFDRCTGAAAPTAADFGCFVEGCAGSNGSVNGCTCAVSNP